MQQLTSVVDSSAEIEGMFSAISYSKGGSILRQVEAFLASLGSAYAGAYYGGINRYIERNAYGNAEPSDLWASFAAASGIAPLATWMSTYELRPGFALVSVSWADSASRTSGVGSLVLSQARFFASPASHDAASAADAATLWWVPLSFVAQHPSAPVSAAITLATQCSSAALPGCAFTGSTYANQIAYSIATDGFLKLNANGTSYYRVAYPPNIWTALYESAAMQLVAKAAGPLSAGDRGELVDDLFSIAEAALPAQLAQGVGTVFALQLASTLLPIEAAYEVWTPALTHLAAVYAFLFPDVPLAFAGNPAVSPFDGTTGPAASACLTAFATKASIMLTPLLAGLGGFNSSATSSVPLLVLLQANALNAASFFGSSSVIAEAKALYDVGWDQAPVDFQSAILRSVSRWSQDGDGVWPSLLGQYNELSAAGSSSASRVLGALSATFDRTQLQMALDFAASSGVRVGDKVSLIAGVAGNPYGRDLAYAFIKSNWNQGLDLFGLYGPGGFDLSTITRATGAGFVTQEYAGDIKSFFSTNPIPGALHDLAQALEGIGQRVNWRAQGEATAVCAAP